MDLQTAEKRLRNLYEEVAKLKGHITSGTVESIAKNPDDMAAMKFFLAHAQPNPDNPLWDWVNKLYPALRKIAGGD